MGDAIDKRVDGAAVGVGIHIDGNAGILGARSCDGEKKERDDEQERDGA